MIPPTHMAVTMIVPMAMIIFNIFMDLLAVIEL